MAAVDRTSVGEKAGEEADQLEDVPPLRKKARVNWSEVWKMLWRSLKGTARSGSFLSMFVVIYHGKSPSLLLLPFSRDSTDARLLPSRHLRSAQDPSASLRIT